MSIVRNLINTLKHFKSASIFNVLGLSVAFAAFTVILIQLNYERNFDRGYSTSDRIFRVLVPSDNLFSVILPRPFIEDVMQSSPHIEAATLINPYIGDIYYSVTDAGQKKGFRSVFVTCSPGITHVFDFHILEGDRDCLTKPEYIIIPRSLASTLFGKESAVGKSLRAEERIWSKNRTDFIIGAVYEDLPDNTQINNSIYTAMDADFAMDQWSASNYICYLLLDDKNSEKNVIDNFNKNYDFSKINREDFGTKRDKITLTPLPDIYYLDEAQDGSIIKSGNRETAKLILGIAVLIIVVAAINFMNFSTSLAPVRMKNINTRKVLGCSDNILRISIVLEAVVIAVLSFVLSIFYIWILNYTSILSFIDADLSITYNMPVVLLCGIISIITGILVGLYPAFYMTSFPPAMVLKGDFGLSITGRKLRTILIGFQFVVSIGLVIAASFIWLQNKYMQNYSLGFDKDQIAIVELNSTLYNNNKEEYVSELKRFPDIEDVAFSMQKLGSQDHYSTSGIKYKDNELTFFMLSVSWNFFKVMGIPVIAGREPSPGDESAGKYVMYYNKDAWKKFDLEIDDSFMHFGVNSELAGFVDNTKFTSLRRENENLAFTLGTSATLPVSYVRLRAGTDYHAAIEHMRKTLQKIDPAYPFEVEFYDTLFGQLYNKEVKLNKMITVFCILAILISIVGVFGLVIFETEYRRKEIGIRKVFGSSILEILGMLNKLYAGIIVVCFIIAVPVVYYGISKWLEGFAYKTPLYWWVFPLGGLSILTITLSVVTFQSRKAALENPVDSIKSE